MKKVMILFTAIILIICNINKAAAQQTNENRQEISDVSLYLDTLSSYPSLYFYQKTFTIEHDYDYEKSNKIKTLQLRKIELEAISMTICLGSAFGVVYLLSNIGLDKDSHLLWKIPTSAAIIAGEVVLFQRYIYKIQKEIDIIQSSSLYSYNINQKLQIDAIHFSNKNDIAQHSFGVSLKFHL